jgi:hypothetical protein
MTHTQAGSFLRQTTKPTLGIPRTDSFRVASHVLRLTLTLLFAVPLVTAALAVVGRFGVNVAYSSGAQYAAELIPTEVRGQGVAAIHMVGYAATFFSTHILYLVSRLTDAAARLTDRTCCAVSQAPRPV